MKKSLAIAVGTVVLLSACAGVPWAQDTKAPTPNPSATATQSDSSMNMNSQMTQMDGHMRKMQGLHLKMTSATTPEERQKVMAEQRQEMQGCMAMMKPMMQGGAMMGGMDGSMMGQKSTQPADASAQMQMMQKRMDMMQMMMQTMMDQQVMMAGPKAMDAAPKK